MQMYQSTPDYYRDVIQHGHKYVEKHRGPSGKWVYKYNRWKSQRAEKNAKKYRDKLANTQMQNFFDRNYKDGIDPYVETTNIKGNYKNRADRHIGTFTYRTTGDKWNPDEPLKRSGRPSSAGWDSGRIGSKSVKTTSVKSKRFIAKKKGVKDDVRYRGKGTGGRSKSESKTKKRITTTTVNSRAMRNDPRYRR